MPDAAFYREQAAKARTEAAEASLDNVRERALRSVKAFETMAASAESVAEQRERRRPVTPATPD